MDDLEQQADEAVSRSDFAGARDLLLQVTHARPTEFQPWLKLAAMCRATGDDARALNAVESALSVQPIEFAALLMRATLLQSLDRPADAGPAFGRAIALAPDNAPPAMVQALAAARQNYAAWQNGEAHRLEAIAASVTSITPNLKRFISNAVRLTEADREGPTHYCYPALAERPFHDRAIFPWLELLEGATDIIQAEFEAVLAAKAAQLVPYIQYPDSVPLDQWKALNKNRDWTAIHLIERGTIVEANATHCPKTLEIMAQLPQPQIAKAGPNVMFSLLAPGTHIPPHTGIANTRLVCHLPLIVPDGCWFRVGEDRREWRRGEVWVFDDTVEHEAMNPSGQLRVILICDIWHPDLSEEERAGVTAVIGAGGGIHGL
jgi:tetratricopeptide (TPR) repeat protein